MKFSLLGVALLCSLGAFAQIQSLDELDDTHTYLLQNANGYGYCIYDASRSAYSGTDTNLSSYSYLTIGGATVEHPSGCVNSAYLEAIDITDENNQWYVVPTGDGNYYLKNMGQQMYATNYYSYTSQTGGWGGGGGHGGGGWGGTQTTTGYTSWMLTSTASPLIINKVSDGVFAFHYATDVDTQGQHYMCAASHASNAVSNWTIDDLGSQWYIVDAAKAMGADDDSLGVIRYITFKDGQMVAIPEKYILGDDDTDEDNVSLSLAGDTTFVYGRGNVESEDTVYTGQLPSFESFKFNNKFNDQLYVDADCTVNDEDNTITTSVACIGKWLVPSFKVPEGATVWVKGKQQHSKVTPQRFNKTLTYTLANPRNWIYKLQSNGKGSFVPFGRDYKVSVDFLTDHSNSQYSVPTIRINTFDGTMITSKDRYWGASFEIDGAGIWDDIKVDSMQIKGRGNSSWSEGSTSKNPYRLKFSEKIKPFGLTKGKNWVLLANKQSGSMTTNAIAMKIADIVESDACNHIIPVELYINGEYRGSYNFTEKVGFSNNSIDIDDESNATLLDLDSYYDDTYKFRDSSYSLYVNLKEPEFDEADCETNLTLSDIQTAFNSLTQAIKGNSGYSAMIDVDAFAKAMLVTDLTRNTELKHPKSWYVYNENIKADSVWHFGPVWDFDWAYGYDGTYSYFTTTAETDIFNGLNSSNLGYPFFYALLNNSDVIKKAYYALWHKFMNDGSMTRLLNYCDDYQAFANASFVHNASKWNDGNGYASTNANAKNWLTKRANYIYSHLTAYDLDEDINDNIDIDFGQPDRIDIAKVMSKQVDVYTIAGILVRKSVPLAESIRGLLPGIYIIDGKKFVVK